MFARLPNSQAANAAPTLSSESKPSCGTTLSLCMIVDLSALLSQQNQKPPATLLSNCVTSLLSDASLLEAVASCCNNNIERACVEIHPIGYGGLRGEGGASLSMDRIAAPSAGASLFFPISATEFSLFPMQSPSDAALRSARKGIDGLAIASAWDYLVREHIVFDATEKEKLNTCAVRHSIIVFASDRVALTRAAVDCIRGLGTYGSDGMRMLEVVGVPFDEDALCAYDDVRGAGECFRQKVRLVSSFGAPGRLWEQQISAAQPRQTRSALPLIAVDVAQLSATITSNRKTEADRGRDRTVNKDDDADRFVNRLVSRIAEWAHRTVAQDIAFINADAEGTNAVPIAVALFDSVDARGEKVSVLLARLETAIRVQPTFTVGTITFRLQLQRHISRLELSRKSTNLQQAHVDADIMLFLGENLLFVRDVEPRALCHQNALLVSGDGDFVDCIRHLLQTPLAVPLPLFTASRPADDAAFQRVKRHITVMGVSASSLSSAWSSVSQSLSSASSLDVTTLV